MEITADQNGVEGNQGKLSRGAKRKRNADPGADATCGTLFSMTPSSVSKGKKRDEKLEWGLS